MSGGKSLNKPIRRIAVVGTGVIGASWATLFLARGFDVLATDPAPNAQSNLRRFVDTAWPGIAKLGLSPKASPEHLSFTTDSRQALADADFVQESAPEDRELKISLFAEMDKAAPADSIIASSSAGLTMSVLQSACKHPERCVIAHPLNPPHVIPLVEVVGGAKTSPEVLQQAMAFYASIGRKPIHIRKEIVGHVANRLQAALYRELAYLIDQDVVDVAAADAAVSWGPGLRWGSWAPICCFILAEVPVGFSASWTVFRSRWPLGGNNSGTLSSARNSGKPSSMERCRRPRTARSSSSLASGTTCCWD